MSWGQQIELGDGLEVANKGRDPLSCLQDNAAIKH